MLVVYLEAWEVQTVLYENIRCGFEVLKKHVAFESQSRLLQCLQTYRYGIVDAIEAISELTIERLQGSIAVTCILRLASQHSHAEIEVSYPGIVVASVLAAIDV